MARLTETVKRVMDGSSEVDSEQSSQERSQEQPTQEQPMPTTTYIAPDKDKGIAMKVNGKPTHLMTESEQRVVGYLEILRDRHGVGRDGRQLRQALQWLIDRVKEGVVEMPFNSVKPMRKER